MHVSDGWQMSTKHEVVFAHFDLPKIDSACFRTTFDFKHKYLWNESRYRQAVNNVFNCDLFHVKCKKFGGLGFPSHKVVFAHFDLPNIYS